MNAVTNIEPLNFAVCRLGLLQDDLKLSVGTGFFHRVTVNGVPTTYLVTNWHVLSGRNSQNPSLPLSKTGALPNRISMNIVMGAVTVGVVQFQEKFVPLYKEDGTATWYQHGSLKNNVDIALMNLGQHLSDIGIFHVNKLATANDMAVTIGSNIFILGYPLGFSYFIDTPIWKRGSIATEPHLEAPNTQNRIVVDATARKGMSGSPVIMRAATHYLSEDGQIKCSANATRLIGVFSSRPQFQSEEPTDTFAEIGYVYKSGCIHDIIVSGTRAPDYGMLP